MFILEKNQQELTPEQEKALDNLYQEALEEVNTLHKMWDDDNVKKEMQWFMDEILEEQFEIIIAQSPHEAQEMAQKKTGEKRYFEPLSYPWFSDRRLVKYYKFGTLIKGMYDGLEKEVKISSRYEQFLNSGIYNIVPIPGSLIVTKPFIYYKTDQDGRLHSIDGPCIEWEDGRKEYAILGIFFEEDKFKKIINKELTKEEIFGEKNTDIRMAILSVYGPEWLLEECNAQKIDEAKLPGPSSDKPYYYAREKSDYYELFLIKKEEKIFSEDRYFLKYQCPSTGRVCVGCIKNEEAKKGAMAAIAWRFETSVEDFLNMQYHA